MAISAYFSIHGLPKLTSDAENWFLNVANVLPRSRAQLSRNLQIYKKIVHDRMNLETVAAIFNLSLTHIKTIVRKIQSAITAVPKEAPTEVEQAEVEVPSNVIQLPVKPVEDEPVEKGCSYRYHDMYAGEIECPSCRKPVVTLPPVPRESPPPDPKALVRSFGELAAQTAVWFRFKFWGR